MSITACPAELRYEIFSYLDNLKDLTNCCLVSKAWKVEASNPKILNNAILHSFAFGKKDWEKYFANVGEEPPLLENIVPILKSPCPFEKKTGIWRWLWMLNPFHHAEPVKTIGQTHDLVLIPKTLDGKPTSLEQLDLLASSPKNEGNSTGCKRCFTLRGKNEALIDSSYWILIKRETINPRKEAYRIHCKQLDELVSSYENYHTPRSLEAIIHAITKYVKTKTKLYETGYTLCEEVRGRKNDFRFAVGGFEHHIFLNIMYLDDGIRLEAIGVNPLQRFPTPTHP